ncbi:Brp/Blh family beta-carotene 15,15'-dioxygenase [Winogradskyella sp. A2]|uniref:Brp/Blh family beta-carotene 15,15'-dioxygenase n=1 Tax=Winogradskyella sp. A2 TaxID=3366944 RepID=UPI00398C5598
MKSSIFGLFLTVFLLWLTQRLSVTYESYLAYGLILTVGIFHGANDISLIRFLNKGSTSHFTKYLLFYLLLVLFTCFIFIKLPLIALFIFVAFSCYHFGEQHFSNQLKVHNNIGNFLYVGYGILIFGLLFYFNYEATSSIIKELTGFVFAEIYYLVFFLIGIVVTGIFGYLSLSNFKKEVELFREIFLILLFALLFKLASLLWAFAIYFIVWHSLPSLKDQIQSLYGNVNTKSFIGYVKSSIIYWLISLIGLVVVYYISESLNIRFITLFFAFLAAITIPHVIVMYYLNKN